MKDVDEMLALAERSELRATRGTRALEYGCVLR
jgi:hypothetical protein